MQLHRLQSKQIGEDEPVALLDSAEPRLDRRGEHRPREDAGVELAVLPARVDAVGRSARSRTKARPVKVPAASGVDAGQARLDARDHLAREAPVAPHKGNTGVSLPASFASR
jgi:hypothetical protein